MGTQKSPFILRRRYAVDRQFFLFGKERRNIDVGISACSKTFKNQEVLHDINMEIHDGEFVVLIGPSGCGKTTSLKMINRLIAPSKGQILLNGSDIRNEDVIRLRRNMGYVIQQTGLFPHMNIEDNMEVIAKLEHVEQAQRRARTRELMEMVGLDYAEFSQRYPQELSGGQQQRVGVARAFALDPDIILMDEPFSALDPITRSSLQDQLFTDSGKREKKRSYS